MPKTQNDPSFPKAWTLFGPVGLTTAADCPFPSEWMLFGPAGKDDPEPDFAGMSGVPAELTIAGRRLEARALAFTGGRFDLGAPLGGQGIGKTAYLLAVVESTKDLDLELGAGADWWMKWWVNGEVVCDTTSAGNRAHPPGVLDHRFTARLKAGGNLIAVKVVSGGGGFALAVGRCFPEPDFAGMTEPPGELVLAGQRLRSRAAVFGADHRLDLGAMSGRAEEGQTAYLLATVAAEREGEVEFGAGADGRMTWWVNGEAVCGTLAAGGGNRPPHPWDERFRARLKAGRNLVAVKVVSGSGGGFTLAACGPRELRGDVPSRVARGDLVDDRPAPRPVEGYPIGNGRMGTLVWTTPGTIEFQINRADVFAVNRAHRGPGGGPLDRGGACGRVSVAVGGEPFRAGNGFERSLSLRDAEAVVAGGGVRARCFVAADRDVLALELDDRRPEPRPLRVDVSMWREPEETAGAHTARHAFAGERDAVRLVQAFTEGDYSCGSGVAARVAGARLGPADDPRRRSLLVPAAAGKRLILVAGAASMNAADDPGAAADALVRSLEGQTYEALRQPHAAWWRAFWDRTYVRIESRDGHGERAARDRMLFLYHMASTSRGAYPPKWNGSIFLTEGDARAWGAQFWLWTTEMLYWPLHAADAGELAEPWFDMYRRQLPALETAARQRWNAPGLFVPEVVPFDGPSELPENLVAEFREIFAHRKLNTRSSPMLAAACAYDHHLNVLFHPAATESGGYTHASHLASSGAELAVHAWWRYRHSGDTEWLRSHAYPLLRGAVEFYRALARRGEDGLWHLHGTNAHEDFWGVTDSIMDLAAIRGVVPLAIRAAEILGADAELCGQWRAFLAELAPYPMGADPRAKALTGGALADDAWAAGYLGAVNGSHNSEDVQLAPIFPFEDWTLETRDPAAAAVARRTMECAPRHRRALEGEPLNTAIRSPIAAIRAGRGAELPAILERYRAAFAPLPNGFSLFEQVRQGQAHSIEHLGLLTMTLQEALLQSVAPRPGEPEVISVFPAWPKAWDAEFRLLARGGFVVTAAIRGGEIQAVEIESRRGGTCRLRNPWGGPCAVREEKHAGDRRVAGETLVLETEAGARYRVEACR